MAALSIAQEAGSEPLSLTLTLSLLAYGQQLEFILVCEHLGDWLGLYQKIMAVKQHEL